MAASVIWTHLASREFDEAAAYIAGDSPAYAAAFVQDVLDAVDLVAEWPESAAIVPEFDDPRIREVFVKNHRIIYEAASGGICIIALVHAARYLPAIWRDRSRPRNPGP